MTKTILHFVGRNLAFAGAAGFVWIAAAPVALAHVPHRLQITWHVAPSAMRCYAITSRGFACPSEITHGQAGSPRPRQGRSRGATSVRERRSRPLPHMLRPRTSCGEIRTVITMVALPAL